MLQNIITLLPHYSEEHFSVFTSNLSRWTIVCSFLFYNKQTSKKTTLKKLSGYEKCSVSDSPMTVGLGGGGGAGEVTPEVCEGWQSAAGTSPSWLKTSSTVVWYSSLCLPWSNAALHQSGINLHFCVNHIVYLHHIILCKSLQHFIM